MKPGEYILLFGRSMRDFFRDGGLMLAGSLSYFSIMAVVPFCLFLISIFFYSLGDNQELFNYFTAKIVDLFPSAAQEVTDELRAAISHRGVGIFIFVVYGVLSYQLYSSLEYAMNVVFKVKEKRSFFSHLMISLFIITVLMAFILLSFAASSSILILNTFKTRVTGIEVMEVTAFLIKYVVPFLLAFVTISAIYIIMPKRKIRWKHAMIGALVATIFQEIAKHAFTIYVFRVAEYGAVYGPLSAVAIFLLWTFCSSCILLMGAEIVHNLEVTVRKRRPGKGQ
jgi:membrane protein